MIKYILILLLFALPATAEQSFGVSALRIDQELFGTIHFKHAAFTLNYSYITDYNVGIKLSLGKSNEVPNSLPFNGKTYMNEITQYRQITMFYRYKLNDKWSIEPSFGHVYYKTKWKVNGKEPHWSNNSDSDVTTAVMAVYQPNKNWAYHAGYNWLYIKYKEGFGKEQTSSYEVGVSYVFN